ncbi:MAG TPA: autotransporter domain-containing protein [Arenimonas sp.]|uniref:autotransporter domain-containing protein n=1 Tax=Arenimonas sp. TaxID=1872635 RepID=UPI002D811621|nr:autotransporter domain-containing protein [Arenimonas sp.]HEU0152078.1 autotransporter domain-containing protein [Arenimonas sp.]
MLTRLTALPWLLAAWLLLAGAASAQVATYAPVGPQNNVPLTTITGGGWTECHRETFATNTPIATISAACNKAQMMMACTNDDNTIQLLAQAPKADVMFDTGTGNVAREANGSAWYFNGSWSWGFAPGGATLNRSSCDGGDDPTFSVNPDPMRMCIHTGANSTSNGWRCGSTTGNNGSGIYAFRRIFFHADGAVAGATVPGAPTAASAVAGNTQATVSFTAPATDGGAAITGYRVTSSPDNVVATGGTSPILVTGLTNGTSYTFTVVAINAVGDSLPSLPSNAVVPVGPPTLSNFNDINRTFGDADFALVPPTSDSAGAFSYTSSNPAVATVSGDTVTLVGAGTTTLTANQAADGGFTAGSTTATLTVAKAVPVVTWIAPLSQTFGDADFSLPAPTSSSPAAFTYSSNNPAVATISGNTVTITGAGSAILTASQPEGANHLAGSATVSLTVATADPGLSGFADLNRVFGEPAFTLSPPASASAGAFTYTSSNPAVATVAGDTVTLVGAGVTTLTANQAADGNYAASSTTATLTVAKAEPAIGWVASLNRTFGDAAFALPAPTSNSTGAFTYTSSNPAVATVSGNTVTIVAAGTATITANQAADANYNAGSASTVLTVGKAAPNLAWIDDIFKTYGEADFDLADPTSASPGAFTFTSANAAVATVSGRTVTITGSGNTVLTASQAETANYAAASVTTTLRVDSRPDPTRDPGVVAGLQAQVDASVRFANAQQTNIRDRLRQVRSGNNASSNALALNMGNGFGPGLSLNAGQALGGDALPLPEGWGWWTAGAITFGDRDASLGSSAFGFQSDGLSFGLDRRVGDNALMGVALGNGFSDADFDADNSSLGGKYKSLSVYGLWRNDRFFVDGVLGAGRLDFDIRRYSALVNDYGVADREGDQRFVSLTVGHEAQGESMRVAGYGRFDASRTDLDAYRESGLGIYDLSYSDQRVDSRTMSIGAEGGNAWATRAGMIRPYWLVEYRKSLKDQSDVGINYVVLPNASDYLLRLRSYADDAVVWGGGVDMDLGPRWGLGLLYRGENVSGVGSSYSVGLQLSWRGGQPSAPVTAEASEASDAAAAAPAMGTTRTGTR